MKASSSDLITPSTDCCCLHSPGCGNATATSSHVWNSHLAPHEHVRDRFLAAAKKAAMAGLCTCQRYPAAGECAWGPAGASACAHRSEMTSCKSSAHRRGGLSTIPAGVWDSRKLVQQAQATIPAGVWDSRKLVQAQEGTHWASKFPIFSAGQLRAVSAFCGSLP